MKIIYEFCIPAEVLVASSLASHSSTTLTRMSKYISTQSQEKMSFTETVLLRLFCVSPILCIPVLNCISWIAKRTLKCVTQGTIPHILSLADKNRFSRHLTTNC